MVQFAGKWRGECRLTQKIDPFFRFATNDFLEKYSIYSKVAARNLETASETHRCLGFPVSEPLEK